MTSPLAPVLVIGAGPGGLSAAAALKARGLPFEIVDSGRKPGGIWDIDRDATPMYESAHFISSRTLSGFPGFPMPESYADYPRHDRIQAYIEAYADHHGLREEATFGVRVESAERHEGGGWRVTLDDGTAREVSAIVVATGMTWYPRAHPLAGQFAGEEMHSFDYRSPRQFDGKRVLIVGGGNSGADIACDAARNASLARISLRRGYHFIPKFVFGTPADVFAHRGPTPPTWLEEKLFGFLMNRVLVGDLTQFGLQKPDHPILRSHPIMNTQILHSLAHGDIEARLDVGSIEGHTVTFSDGVSEDFDLIVWAIGYEWRFPFLDEDDLDRKDGVLDLYLHIFHRRHPDLFFMGVFETDGAAYGTFGQQAALIATYLDRASRGEPPPAFDRTREHARPDLRGGRAFVSSPRHDYYVRAETYRKALRVAARAVGGD